MHIADAISDADIARCHPVLVQLRPALKTPADAVARVRALMADGYRFTCLEDEGRVVACAGWRFGDKLAWGKHVYVDDLVTAADAHGRGYGGRLLAWLAQQARAAGCVSLHLDSGVQRFPAHRFYLGKGMRISSHHFAQDL